MSTIVTRAGKGSPLTNTEVDANFTNLNTDKIQSGNTVALLTINDLNVDTATITSGTVTGLTATSGTIGTLTSTTGTITNLNATNGDINNLDTAVGTISDLTSSTGTITTLNSTTATLGAVNANTGSVGNLIATTLRFGTDQTNIETYTNEVSIALTQMATSFVNTNTLFIQNHAFA
jgi:hypothetical protein